MYQYILTSQCHCMCLKELIAIYTEKLVSSDTVYGKTFAGETYTVTRKNFAGKVSWTSCMPSFNKNNE